MKFVLYPTGEVPPPPYHCTLSPIKIQNQTLNLYQLSNLLTIPLTNHLTFQLTTLLPTLHDPNQHVASCSSPYPTHGHPSHKEQC